MYQFLSVCLEKISFLHRYYIPILLLAILASIAGGYYASKLRLESDLAELLPDTFESVKALHKIKQEIGAVGHLRIILESKRFGAAKKLADEIAGRLQSSPFVKYVEYKNDIEFYNKNSLLYLSVDELDSLQVSIRNKIDAEKQKLNPLFVDDLFEDESDDTEDDGLSTFEEKYKDQELREYYTNADSTVLVIKVYPTGTSTSISYIQKMLADVRTRVNAAAPQTYSDDMKVLYGGSFKNRLDEFQVVKKDILGTAYYGFGGIFLLIIVYFRKILGALLITLTLIFSLSWTFGVAYLFIGTLNTITGFLFVILFGLGIDYGIHAFARYVESRRAGLGFEDSIAKLFCYTGKALVTTAITTAAAFFSLTVMDFKGFSELGFISGVGIMFALIAMVFVLPAFITLFDRLGLLKIQPATLNGPNFQQRKFPFSRPILIVSSILTLVSVWALFKVKFEYDFTNLRAITEERQIVSEKTKGVFTLSESPAVILADSRQEIEEIVATVKRIIRRDTLSPTIKTVRSIYSLVPDKQPEKLARIKDIRQLVEREADGVVKGADKKRLDRLKQYLDVKDTFSMQDVPEKLKRAFMTKKGEIGNFVFIYPSVALRDGKNAIAFREDVHEIKTPSGKTYYAASSNIVLAEMLVIMLREGKQAVLLTIFVVFLIVLADFRNLKATLLVLSPLMIGVILMIGAMYLFDLKWNLFNIVVIPSVMGIGVDNGVHIFHRYAEEGDGSLIHVLKNTGLAITMTTLTTIVGYSGLIAARHPGLNSIGDLALIGISLTFLTAVVFLPAALQFMEDRRKQ